MDTTIGAILIVIVGFIVSYLMWLLSTMREKIGVLEQENNALANMILQHIISAKDEPGEQTQ